MPSSKNTRKKKKAVAALLLLLCAAMLTLLIMLKIQGDGASGGGGGGGAVAANQPDAQDQNGTEPVKPGETVQKPQVSKPAGADVESEEGNPPQAAQSAERADVPALSVITWKPYDSSKLAFSKHRVVIKDETGKQVISKDLGESDNKLPLDGLGLVENGLYQYQILPITLQNVDLSRQDGQDVKQGAFYVDLLEEKPTAPIVLSPGNNTNVSTTTPVIEWKAATDPDPHDAAKMRYKVTLSRDGAENVWSAEVEDTQVEVGETLRENTTYTVTVVAVDPKDLESEPATSKFSVDASKDKPGVPSNLNVIAKVPEESWLLDWGRSKDPNPGGSVTSYFVEIKDADSDTVVHKASTRHTYLGFPDGVYGKKYFFRVKAKNNFGIFSRASTWSGPHKYVLNYDCVPDLVRPAKESDAIAAKVGISWIACEDAANYTVKIGTQEYTTTENIFTFSDLQKKGTLKLGEAYPVQVRVTNTSGYTSAYSDPRVFKVVDSSPAPPGEVLVSNTLSGTDETERDDTLSWEPVQDLEGEVTYEVQMSSSDDFSAPEVTYPTNKTTVSFDEFWKQWRALEGNRAYHVRVVSIDSAGNRSAGKASLYNKTDN